MAMRSRRDQEDGLAGTFRFRERARERSIPGDAGLPGDGLLAGDLSSTN